MANILRGAGLDPGPKRGEGTWDEFIRRHAATLWACDFLSVRSATIKGFVDLHLLFFIHVGTRRVVVSGVTANPDSAWMAQQARNASMGMAELGLPARFLLLDHDGKLTQEFDAVFEAAGAEVKRVGPVAPNLNAYAEGLAQTLRQECLDHSSWCWARTTCGTSSGSSSSTTTPSAHIRDVATSRSPLLRRLTPANRRSCRFRPARCGAGSGWAACSSTTTAPQPDVIHNL